MKRNRLLPALVLALAALVAGCRPDAVPERPHNIILFISDGCGPASFTFARGYAQEVLGREVLTTDSLLVGSIRTRSTDSRVTDSAAGATAFACGVKTYNGAIAVDTARQRLATVLEAAEARGMATGLVVTSTITHATPAAFSAHVSSRSMEPEIAAQQLEQGIEVLFGGGRSLFLPETQGGRRKDGRNLLEEARERGYTVLSGRADFDGPLQTPVLGLFSDGHMAYELDRDPARQPSLAEMTRKAITLLKDRPEGFFLMVEGSRIDHAAHVNDAAGHLHDILAFEDAVTVALDFARQDGQTLLLSTSDHETGGLSLGRNLDGAAIYAWKPSVLEPVKHSYEHLATLLEAGMKPDALFSEEYGIDDATAAEQDRLRMAQNTKDVGMAMRVISEAIARRAFIGWTTNGHTGVDVNLYAFGPGAKRFSGNHDNTFIGRMLFDYLGADREALTTAMRSAEEGN